MGEVVTEVHREGCTGAQHYTDGIVWTCYCKALCINTFAGAKFKHSDAKQGCKVCVPQPDPSSARREG